MVTNKGEYLPSNRFPNPIACNDYTIHGALPEEIGLVSRNVWNVEPKKSESL